MLLLRHLKSYLPAHSILRGFVALHLCDFADAIRAGCAEAKRQHGVLLADRLGCNPCGMFRNERKVIVFKRSCAEQ